MANKSVENTTIKCCNCGYETNQKDLIRCPRCFQMLLSLSCQGNCSKCHGHGK